MRQQGDTLGAGQRAFQQAIEETLVNIKWMNANEHVITEWLNKRKSQR